MKLNTIVRFLNRELKISKIKDSSKNGLQAGGKNDIVKIGFAVDACLEVFEKAKKKKCDLVVVHHGILWKGKLKREELLQKRINYLKKNKMSLYAVHAPLDKHKIYGNNIQLAKIIGAKNLRSFAYQDGIYWGYWGSVRPTTIETLKRELDRKLKTKSKVIVSKRNKIRKVGICSGSAWFGISEAKKKNLDLYVVGEIKHMNYHEAKELGVNVIAPGHYATETSGVKALMKLLKEKFKIKTEFIDAPTGL